MRQRAGGRVLTAGRCAAQVANNQYIEMREVSVSHDGESFGMQPGKPLILRCAARLQLAARCGAPACAVACASCTRQAPAVARRACLPDQPASAPARCLRYKNPNYWYHESYFGAWCKAPIDKHLEQQYKEGLLARARADKMAADAANAAAQGTAAS